MMTMQPILLFAHLAGVVVWVGGMFFAYFCLRPAALEVLDPPPRLRLWRAVLARFFAGVAWAAALIAASGLLMFVWRGGGPAPLGWQLMSASGALMIAIFIHVVVGPFSALRRAVDGEDWPAGAAALNRIRRLVAANLILGVATLALATIGRYLG